MPKEEKKSSNSILKLDHKCFPEGNIGSYLIFKKIGSVIPQEKHPLSTIIDNSPCDFIISKSDIALAKRIGIEPAKLETLIDIIEKTIEFKSSCLSKSDLQRKLLMKKPDCLDFLNEEQFDEIYLHWRQRRKDNGNALERSFWKRY